MKILWLSNKRLSGQDNGSTATWINAMSDGLVNAGQVELANICTGFVTEFTRQDFGQIKQWLVPATAKLHGDGLPDKKIVEQIVQAVRDFSPDLIHVWGTEGYFGLLTARKLLDGATLLETQGLKFRIAEVYHGGLSLGEQWSCLGVKEILRQTAIWQCRKKFQKWGVFEKEIIA